MKNVPDILKNQKNLDKKSKRKYNKRRVRVGMFTRLRARKILNRIRALLMVLFYQMRLSCQADFTPGKIGE